MTFDVGTLGPSACEINLSKILAELDNPKINNKVTKIFHALTRNLIDLQILKPTNPKLYLKLANMLYAEAIARFETLEPILPKLVYTHSLCCLKVIYGRNRI